MRERDDMYTNTQNIFLLQCETLLTINIPLHIYRENI